MSKAKKPMFKAGQVVKTTRFIAHPILGIPRQRGRRRQGLSRDADGRHLLTERGSK